MILLALLAAAVSLLTIGFLLGLYADNRVYRIPEHPSTWQTSQWNPPRWRVIEGGKQPYDQDEGRSV